MSLTPRLALMLTLPPLLWAGNAVVGRAVGAQVPPLLLNAMRWTLAFALLVLVAPRARALLQDLTPLWRRWGYFALSGLLGMGCYNALQYQALHSSTALNVTLIAASLPVWMLAVGAMIYRVWPTRRQLAGAALSLAGVALVISRGRLERLAEVQFVRGDLLMLLAVISWAFYSWLLARPPAHMRGDDRPDWDWSQLLMAQLVFGLAFGVASAGVEQAIGAAPVRWGWPLAAALAYVAIGPSLIAYRCWGLGVAQAGPTLAAFFGNLTPVFAALMSAALLGEWPAWFHGAAFALIAAGIAVSAPRRG
ncbi:MAG: DMT family transporter [Mitsuaria chitosanitabida]|uniref:DMT family transporter n=1 Tax=Roseateles chitosanitabidus TaxID=65048 RepID=UPI001B047A4A|nr:DMT family transporter [Roseateles chitosanitabidus]MBO9686336.1 DMT family transporter [Roseateles chitosanitabidus]